MARWNPFKKKPKPTYQYSKPIGPVQPGKTIPSPQPGEQYSSPIGPVRPSGGGSGGSSSGNSDAERLAASNQYAQQELARQKAAAEQKEKQQAEQKRLAQLELQRQQAIVNQKKQQGEDNVLVQSVNASKISFNESRNNLAKNQMNNSPPKKGVVQKVKETYNKTNTFVAEKVTKPVYNKLEEKGIKLTDSKFQAKFTPSIVGVGPFGLQSNKETKDLYGGFQAGIQEDIRDKPLKQVVLYGGGRVAGAGLGLVGQGISSLPKIGGVASTTFKVSEAGAGAYLGYDFIKNVNKNVKSSINNSDKGKVVGVAAKDTFLLGSGFSAGGKDALKIAQNVRVLGRKEIPTELLIPKDVLTGNKKFVESPTGKINAKEYKNLFETKSQVVPGIKEPIGYTSTPTKFWNGKKFKVTQPGTSEFPGVYVAYRPSPYFLKINAGSSSSLSIPKVKDLFTVSKPATAGVIPSKFVIGKTAKPGEAFIPAIKPEVEAILPVGTKANIINKNYFYKWEGTKVPLDIFKVEKSITKTTGKNNFNPTSYSSSSKTSSVFNLGAVPKSSSYSNKNNVNNYIASSTTSSGSSTTRRVSPPKSYGGSSGRSSPKIFSSSPSVPISNKPSSPVSNPRSNSKSFSYFPRRSYSSSLLGSSTNNIKKTPKVAGFKLPKVAAIKPKKTYGVQVRRRGQWFNAGSSQTLGGAFSLGRSKVSNTLAASFRLTNNKGKSVPLPSGFTRSKKEKDVFVELNKYRLSKKSETSEIQGFKAAKGSRKKKKSKRKKK